MKLLLFSLFALLALLAVSHAFTAPMPAVLRHSQKATSVRRSLLCSSRRMQSLSMTAAKETKEESDTMQGLPVQRYVACNRFLVREGAGPKFEKRWAERKSSLASLAGFKFFTLLRRCDDMPDMQQDDGSLKRYPEGTPDYMSMTWWQNKKNFNSWRTGPAFKEAHGGGSIGGFLSAIVGSLMVLKTAPAPSMWEGLLAESVASSPISLKARDADGKAQADGSTPLPAECFVAMNRFRVKEGKEAEFEAVFENRESSLKDFEGFAGFTLLRSSAIASKGGGGSEAFAGENGLNYSTCSIWDCKESWIKWFKDSRKGSSSSPGGMKDLLNGPPSPVFWDGVLVLESADGA